MADNDKLAIGGGVHLSTEMVNPDTYTLTVTMTGVTAETAEAMVKVEEAKRDAAIAQAAAMVEKAKAEERTAVAVEEKKTAVPARQATLRQLIVGAVVTGGIIACCLFPLAAPYVGGVVLVLGGTEIARIVVDRKKKGDDE